MELLETGQTSDGTPYIVLELLSGEPLLDYLLREGALETAETMQLIQQMADGLDHLHKHGIVHRDIKAENIFIRNDGGQLVIKLFDFGLAKNPQDEKAGAAKPLTGIGVMVGTLEYMSPEQMLSSKDADHNADLWALAVIAYVTTAGKLPFESKELAETFKKIHAGEFERPSAVRDDIGTAVDEWFERAFTSNIEERFARAGDMAAALRQALAAPRAPALPPTLPTTAPTFDPDLQPRKGPSPPLLIAITIGVLVVLVGVAALAMR